jgi:Rrf2 family protein
MRLTLTRRAAHGIALMKTLAKMPAGSKMTAAELAELSGVPRGFVPAIVATLHRAGLVRCLPGRSGGCYLARAPEEVSVLEVVNALDGPLIETHCVLEGRLCMETENCEVHDYWQRAHDAMRNSLEKCSLKELTDSESASVSET